MTSAKLEIKMIKTMKRGSRIMVTGNTQKALKQLITILY